jgi:anti-anti-sigma factor
MHVVEGDLEVRSGPQGELILVGEVDLAAGAVLPRAVDALIAAGHGGVVVDVGGVTFADSTLLDVFARLLRADVRVVVRHPSWMLVRMLIATGMLDAVTVEAPELGFIAGGTRRLPRGL